MIFSVEHEGERREIEVRRDGNTTVVVDGGETLEVDAHAVAPGWWSILLGSRSFDAGVERDGTSYTVDIDGKRFVYDLTDPARAALKRAAGGIHGHGLIKAPMPGRVLRILVQAGQEVAHGDGVIVVEAMKMENELAAPRDGVVTEIAVQEGETVEGGTPLVTIGEPQSE